MRFRSAALYGAPLLQGHRAQFNEILANEAKRLGVDVRYGVEVGEYWDLPTQPCVVVDEGDAMEADVVLIANGVKSDGRELLEDSFTASRITRLSEGYSVWRGLVRSDAFLEDEELSSGCFRLASEEGNNADSILAELLDGNQRFWFGEDSHATLSSIDGGRQVSFVSAAPLSGHPRLIALYQTLTHRDPRRKATTDPHNRRSVGEVLSLLEGWDPRLFRAVALFKTMLNWRITEE